MYRDHTPAVLTVDQQQQREQVLPLLSSRRPPLLPSSPLPAASQPRPHRLAVLHFMDSVVVSDGLDQLLALRASALLVDNITASACHKQIAWKRNWVWLQIVYIWTVYMWSRSRAVIEGVGRTYFISSTTTLPVLVVD